MGSEASTAPRHLFWKVEAKKAPWNYIPDTAEAKAEAIRNGAMYFSFYSFERKPKQAGEESSDYLNNLVKRYGHLNFDIDCAKDADAALAAAQALVFEVLPSFDVQPEQVRVWFSGSKGYHIEVPDWLYGGEQGDALLPIIQIYMVQNLVPDTLKPVLDQNIYNMGWGRMFRIENVRRENGLYKIPLSVDEIRPGSGLTAGQIRELAAAPRQVATCSPAAGKIAPGLATLFKKGVEYSRTWLKSSISRSLETLSEEQVEALTKELPACMRTALSSEDYGGNGDLNFSKLLAFVVVPYFRKIGMSMEEAMDACSGFLAGFNGSESYTTADSRFKKFEDTWYQSSKYEWKCGIAAAWFKPNCGGCPVRAEELATVFDDFGNKLVEQDPEPKDTGPAWIPFDLFEQALEGGKKPGPLAHSVADMTPEDIPPRDWIIHTRFVPQFVTVTVAPGGGSKSTLSTLEAIAVVTGKPLSGMKVMKKGGVWLYNAEDPKDELERKIAAACAHHGVDTRKLTGLYYRSGQDEKALVFVKDDPSNGLMVNQVVVNKVIQFIKAKNILLMVLDPFVRTHRVNENDNMQIDAVVAVLSRIANVTGCAIHVVHHTRKMGKEGGYGDMETARGASSNVSAARVVHTINTMTEKEAEKYGVPKDRASYYIRLDDAKGNFSAPTKSTLWFERSGVVLSNGKDEVGVLKASDIKPLDEVTRDTSEGEGELLRVIAEYVRPGKSASLGAVVEHIMMDGSALPFLGEKSPSVRTLRRRIEEKYLSAPRQIGQVVLSIKTEEGDSYARKWVSSTLVLTPTAPAPTKQVSGDEF